MTYQAHLHKSLIINAEREGFEPPVPCSTPDFESGTLNQLCHLSVPRRSTFSGRRRGHYSTQHLPFFRLRREIKPDTAFNQGFRGGYALVIYSVYDPYSTTFSMQMLFLNHFSNISQIQMPDPYLEKHNTKPIEPVVCLL